MILKFPGKDNDMGNNTSNRLLVMDGLKLMAAYFVVTIHTGFHGAFDSCLRAVSEFAVPFFFMCSGYFLYGNSPEKNWKRTGHVLKLFLGAALLYTLYQLATIAGLQDVQTAKAYFLGLLRRDMIIRTLVFNDTAIPHLWYLNALVYVCFIHYWLSRWKVSDKVLFGSVLILLTLRILIWQTFTAVVPENGGYIYIVRNFLFEAYPMVGIGMAIRRFRSALPRITLPKLAVLLTVAACEAIFERVVLGQEAIPFGATMIAVLLLLYSLDAQPKGKGQFLEMAGVYSTFVYIMHPMIIDALSILFLVVGFSLDSPLKVNGFPFLVCFLSTVAAWIFYTLRKAAVDWYREKRRDNHGTYA